MGWRCDVVVHCWLKFKFFFLLSLFMLLTTTINYFFVDLRWLGWRRWWYNLKLAYPAYPPTNTADFLIKGKASTSDVIKSRSALPLDGNKGGLPELIIDPKNVK
jgi:hypothetical protein